MRPIQQAQMAPTHHQPVQHPHAHRTHQQLSSMASYQQQQHMHHMQHPAMTNPRMLMGMNSPNPNGKFCFTALMIIIHTYVLYTLCILKLSISCLAA